MATTKARTLSYRRVAWPVGAPKPFGSLLQDVLTARSDIAATRVVNSEGVVWDVRHRDVDGGRVFLHIAAHTPDEEASTVVRAAAQESDLKRTPAPPGEDYLDGDAMLLVCGDDVIVCVSNVHEITLIWYLRSLIELGGRPEIAKNFEVQKVANPKIVRSLVREGVKSIRLNVSTFSATLPMTFNDSVSVADALLEKLNSALTVVIGRDRTPAEMERQAGLETGVEIRANGRNDMALQAAATTAQNVLDLFEGGYEITTRRGIRITAQEVSVREQGRFPADGKTVFYADVWSHMGAFYDSLVRANINVQ